MKEFIALHNRTVSRDEIQTVIDLAKEQNNTEVIYRLSKILNDHPDSKRFNINIINYPQETTQQVTLAGTRHSGDYREALDECGRLKKGWHFVDGKVVKVQKRSGLLSQYTEKEFGHPFTKTLKAKFKELNWKYDRKNKRYYTPVPENETEKEQQAQMFAFIEQEKATLEVNKPEKSTKTPSDKSAPSDSSSNKTTLYKLNFSDVNYNKKIVENLKNNQTGEYDLLKKDMIGINFSLAILEKYLSLEQLSTLYGKEKEAKKDYAFVKERIEWAFNHNIKTAKRYHTLNACKEFFAEKLPTLLAKGGQWLEAKAQGKNSATAKGQFTKVVKQTFDEMALIAVLSERDNDEIAFLSAAGIDYFPEAPDDQTQGLGKPVPAADIYKMVTDKIIGMLKSASPTDYHRAWKDDAFFIPLNYDSKKPYRGVNRLLLQERIGFAGAFRNPYFLTFKQIKKHKGTLKKGAKGYEVIYYSIRYVVPADKNSGRKAYSSTNAQKVLDFLHKYKLSEDIVGRIPMIRYYNVYNGADIENIDFKLDELQIGRAVPDSATENRAAQLIVENYPNPPAIKHEGNQAYYNPASDYIKLPKQEQFDTVNDYYRTLFHELTHSTGHNKRLNRGIHLMLEKDDYAKEELVAEFGAVFLSAWAGIMWYNNKNHAAYLKGWNSAIKEAQNDNKFLMRAASLAQQATDYILALDKDGNPAFLKKLQGKKAPQKAPKTPTDKSAPSDTESYFLQREEQVKRAELIRKARKQGHTEEEIRQRAKKLGYDNIDLLINLSYLNPKGEISRAYIYYPDNETPTITKMVNWAGEARRKYPFLEDEHEQQFFDLYDQQFYEKKDKKYLFEKIEELASKYHSFEELMKKHNIKGNVFFFDKLIAAVKVSLRKSNYKEVPDWYIRYSVPIDTDKPLTKENKDFLKKYFAAEVSKVVKPFALKEKYTTWVEFKQKGLELLSKIITPSAKSDKSAPSDSSSNKNLFLEEYRQLKSKYPEHLIIFSMEDQQNYTMYGKDAVIAADILNLQLLKGKGNDEFSNSVGFKSNYLREYIEKLVKAGYKVAVRGNDLDKPQSSPKKNKTTKPSNPTKTPIAPTDPMSNELLYFNSVPQRQLVTRIKAKSMKLDFEDEYYNNLADKDGYFKPDFQNKSNLKIITDNCDNFVGTINTYDYPIISVPKPKTTGIMSLKKIVSTDNMRPVMKGVYIDKNHYIATDAHKLVFIPRPKNDEYRTGTIFDINFKCKKLGGCKTEEALIDGHFPIEIINKMKSEENSYISPPLNIENVISHLYCGEKAINIFTTYEKYKVITLYFEKERKTNYINIKHLLDTLEVLRSNGAKTFTLGFLNLEGKRQINIDTDNKLKAIIMPNYYQVNESPTSENCIMIAPINLILYKQFRPKKGLSVPTDGTLFGTLPTFKTRKEAKKYFKAWAAENLTGKKVYHKELDKYVVFSSRGIDHVLSSNISFNKMKLILQAEEMLKNSHLIAFEEDYKKRENIKGVYRMRSNAILEGEDIKVILTLREGENGVIYYDHKIEEIKESTTPPRKSLANPFCGDSAPTNTPAKTVPNSTLSAPEVFVEHSSDPYTQPAPSITPRNNSLANRMANLQNRTFETFIIAEPQMQAFLGDVERKNTGSTAITITGGAGSGKTRFAFQFINALAQNYKVGHASLEEQPDSKLYFDKVQQYLDQTAQANVEAPEIENMQDLQALIERNDVIVIDSFTKIREWNRNFLLDRDLRKKYNGKLFLIIFQQTVAGNMRGGTTSEFDGDIILYTQVFPDYRENYIYPSKNRYNSTPSEQLRYSVYHQQLLPSESTPPDSSPVTSNTYEVIY